MDPSLLLVLSSMLQLHQFMEWSTVSASSSSTDPVPLLFFVLSAVLTHAAAALDSSLQPGDASKRAPKHSRSPTAPIKRSLDSIGSHSQGRMLEMYYARRAQAWGLDPHIRDQEWRKHYGLSFPLFMSLVNDIVVHTSGGTCSGMPADAAVAMVLQRLARGHDAKRVGKDYGMDAGAVARITNTITRILSTTLYSKYICIPRGARLLDIVEGFKDLTGLPNMCGAIDGSPMKLHKQPALQYTPSNYMSRHHFHAIHLQAVCDYKKVFWDVCVRAPGASDDAKHFRQSSLYHKLMVGDVLYDSTITIRGNHIRPYLVGDWCYPLLSFLLTPFSSSGSGNSAHNLLDSLLMKGGAVVKEALGLLKGRWQILQDLNMSVDHASQAIVACCVLHNICQISGEPEVSLFEDPVENGTAEKPLESEKSSHYFGESIRQAFLEEVIERHQRCLQK